MPASAGPWVHHTYADPATQLLQWELGKAASQAERSPAMLMDGDGLGVLAACFLVKPFYKSSAVPGARVSQAV